MALDWNNAATGALAGAGIGSAGGPWGAAAGGLIGGLTGIFGGGRSKKSKIKSLPNFDPDQLEVLKDLSEGVRGGNKDALAYLNSILSDEEGAFEDFERPFQNQFEQYTIPNVLELFTGQGARNSSAARQALASEGRNLSTNLAAQRAALKSGAINQLLSFNDKALTKRRTNYIKEGKKGTWESQQGPASEGLKEGLGEFLSWLKNSTTGNATVGGI